MSKITKLSEDLIETLNELGIEGLTDADVRPELIARLKEVDVDEMDNDPIEDLIAILQAFAEIEKPIIKTIVEIDSPTQTIVSKNSIKKDNSTKVLKSKKVNKIVKNTRTFLDLIGNEEHKKLVFDQFVNRYIDRGYDITVGNRIISFRTSNGVSDRCVLTFDDLRIDKNGRITTWLGFNAFRLVKSEGKNIETLSNLLPEDYVDSLNVYTSGLLYIKDIDANDVKKILSKELLNYMDGIMGKLDKKLTANRKRMEDSIEE